VPRRSDDPNLGFVIANPTGRMLERVGRIVISLLASAGDVSIFAFKVLRELFVPPFEIRETIRQLFELGLRSAPLIAVSGVAVGVVLSMHTRASLERFGAEAMIPAGLAIALVRETGPLTAGLLLSGRIGAGIGAELGAMRVTEQIDALEASAVDSFRYLVVTRVAACIVALPILTTIMNFSGMLGGFLAETATTGMPFPLYLNRAFSIVELIDYVPATVKTMVFGFIIATMSSYLGFTTESGTEGVGRASTRAVVFSSMLIIVANVVLVRLIFFIFPKAGGG
jgi:phospholipid/cholesterol/gamma-HCH transport system permease protein